MAKSGQWISHILHLVQTLASITEIFPLASRAKTPFGQSATQMPQPLHHFCRTAISTGFKWDRLFIAFTSRRSYMFRLSNTISNCHANSHIILLVIRNFFHMTCKTLVSRHFFFVDRKKKVERRYLSTSINRAVLNGLSQNETAPVSVSPTRPSHFAIYLIMGFTSSAASLTAFLAALGA